LDGREIDCVTVGNGPTVGWIIHRQHPGETMAEYFAEGLILRLLDDSNEKAQDEIVKKALDMFTFHIIPNMCPDGSVRGYLRTNSCGANLNREWCSNGDYTVRLHN
jgi:murein tripeptide amidase MpaA